VDVRKGLEKGEGIQQRKERVAIGDRWRFVATMFRRITPTEIRKVSTFSGNMLRALRMSVAAATVDRWTDAAAVATIPSPLKLILLRWCTEGSRFLSSGHNPSRIK
jgi:hypothetical protein